MSKKSVKNMVLMVMFVILAPVILLGMTVLGNSIAGKSKQNPTVQTANTTQTAKVPEENKATDSNIPKANEEKVSNNASNNTSNNNNTNNSTTSTSKKSIAGQEYTVKTGDTLFTIAAAAYGESNTKAGVEKIKEANNMQNNNLNAGQKIQIPKF